MAQFGNNASSKQQGGGQLLNMGNFLDTTNIDNRFDYSEWIRGYGKYLDEQLEVYRELTFYPVSLYQAHCQLTGAPALIFSVCYELNVIGGLGEPLTLASYGLLAAPSYCRARFLVASRNTLYCVMPGLSDNWSRYEWMEQVCAGLQPYRSTPQESIRGCKAATHPGLP